MNWGKSPAQFWLLTKFTPLWARGPRPAAAWTLQICSSPYWRRAGCAVWGPPRMRSSATTLRRIAPCRVVSSALKSTSLPRRTVWKSCAASSRNTKCSTGYAIPEVPCRRPWNFPPAMCGTGFCRTRPLTSWTRRARLRPCARASSPARWFPCRMWSGLSPVWPGCRRAP